MRQTRIAEREQAQDGVRANESASSEPEENYRNVFDAARQPMWEAGFDAHLVKPVSLDAIRELLASRV